MARPKKEKRATSFVTLRTKSLSKGRKSFYLDFYKSGNREYEFLNIYLLAGNDDETKRLNEKATEAAQAIRNRRENEILSGAAGLNAKKVQIKLLEWVDIYAEKKHQLGQSEERATSVKKMKAHLLAFAGENKTMAQIDEQFCKDFILFLAGAKSGKHTKHPRQLAKTTATNYYQTFVSILNEAVREKIIAANPANYLSKEDKKPIKAGDSTRPYLTIDEVKKLEETPYNGKDDTKRAFLFGCYTGLRCGDIKALKWEDIKQRDNGQYIEIVMQKTRKPHTIKLNKQALLCLPPQNGSEYVFTISPDRYTLNTRLKKWIASAGITKDVCFHVSRHTFATAGLTMGADLYTMSKLLGHGDIATTQIYADIVNKKRDEAVDLWDNAFK